MRAKRHRRLLPGVFAAALAALALGRVLDNDWAWDDAQFVFQNPALHSLANVPRFFSPRYWAAEERTVLRSYRPARELSLALDYAVWGPTPAGYHLTSLLAHLAAVALAYALAARIGLSRMQALLAAAVFALHPSRVEVLATVENRSEVFAAVGCLAAFLLWDAARRREGPRRWLRAAAAAAAFAFALLSKTIACALPLAMAGAAWCGPRPRGRDARFAVVSIALAAALAAGFLAATMSLVAPDQAERAPLQRLSPAWTPALVAKTLGWYAAAAAAPLRARPDAQLARPDGPLWAWYAAAAALAAAGLAWLAYARRRPGPAHFGLAWTLAFLAPVLNCPLIPLRPVAEQRLYLPLAGLSAAAAAGLRSGPPAAAALAGVLAFAALSNGRIPLWRDNAALWRGAVRPAPDNPRARHNLGMQYLARGKLNEAVRQLEDALRIDPAARDTSRSLASAYERMGLLAEAAKRLREAARLAPRDAGLLVKLADVEGRRGRWAEAERLCRRAMRAAPSRADAYLLLAGVELKRGRPDAARAALEEGALRAPGSAELWTRLSQAYLAAGDPARAADAARRAAALRARQGGRP